MVDMPGGVYMVGMPGWWIDMWWIDMSIGWIYYIYDIYGGYVWIDICGGGYQMYVSIWWVCLDGR